MQIGQISGNSSNFLWRPLLWIERGSTHNQADLKRTFNENQLLLAKQKPTKRKRSVLVAKHPQLEQRLGRPLAVEPESRVSKQPSVGVNGRIKENTTYAVQVSDYSMERNPLKNSLQ